MTALALVITEAGLARFTAAQLAGGVALAVSHVGLTGQVIVSAPTLTALPGQFATLDTISGVAVGDDVVHMTVRDASAAAYEVRGFGLFLSDGTLFAVYAQPQPLVEKSAASTLFLAIDIAFPIGTTTQLVFGSTDFLYPPATTTTAGVAPIATQAEVDAGTEPAKIVTPATLATRLTAIVNGMSALIAGAIATCIPLAQRGVAGGVATLGPDIKVTPAQLPPLVSPAALAAALAHLIPTGTIALFGGAAAPDGWAICDGATVERADGTGTITTPDLRGRVAVGASADHALGLAFGQTVGELHTDPAETGVALNFSTYGALAGGGTHTAVAAGSEGAPPSLTDPGHAHTGTVDVTQPSLALTYIIKL